MPEQFFQTGLCPDGYATQDMDYHSLDRSIDQPGASPSYTAPPPSENAALAIARINYTQVRAFARRTHFNDFYQAETNLYATVLYFGCSQNGMISGISFKRPTRFTRDPDMEYVRVIAFGTLEMFTNNRSPRPFFFDIQRKRVDGWNHFFSTVLSATQYHLNQRALWLQRGFSTPSAPAIVASAATRGIGATSPPGHGPHSVQLSPLPNQVALDNLQALVHASVLQAAATLFLDEQGRLVNILYGRPDGQQLQFLVDEEERDEHATIVRIGVNGAKVELCHPYDNLNPVQDQVVRCMARILNGAYA